MVGILPRSKFARREALWFWLFISPWIIGFLLFRGIPIFASMGLSFTNFSNSSVRPTEFIGIDNYLALFNDKIFYKALQVSFLYTLFSVPLGLIFSLGLAMVLNQRVPFLGFFRTAYYLPALIGGSVAVAFLFQLMLNPTFGVVNYFISRLVGPNGLIPLGIKGPGWFFDPDWVMPSFVLLSLWGFGGPMLIYLAGLQGVPTSLYEAARIDGANGWQRFRNVTLPMVSPVILFNFITGIIGSFQVFTPAYVISNGEGGPAYASMFYVLYLYLNAFRRYRFGYASAQAWLLFIVILVLTILALRASRAAVYYESPGDDKTV
ncbi:MAG: sugar ABC transporter permease [Caldilineaceae bacterium]|nr:sugar ABC transporter permease [Caldilineaceae bacterium]